MKLDPILEKATRLIRRKDYDGALRTLEPEVNRYRGSFRFYYLSALACLYSRDNKGAKTYFELANKTKGSDPGVLLGLAVLSLHRGDTAKAVDYYLEILEKNGKNRTAQRALHQIKKYAGKDRLADWLDSAAYRRVFPPPPSLPLSWNRVLPPVLLLVLVLGAGLGGVLIRQGIIEAPWAKKAARSAGEAALDRGERANPVETGGAYRYVLTRSQVLEEYDRALSLFSGFRDEHARIRLNRILESNASPAIKNKARLLASFMEEPGFDRFRREDNFSYAEVIKDPLLYRDCHVIWRGMATNAATEEGTRFDFLVGYDTRKTLEGIVPVRFGRAVSLNSEEPLEVLGRVIPVSTPDGMNVSLEGLAIHQAAASALGKKP